MVVGHSLTRATGIVTYRVEAFATEIKIESKPFWGADQGIKVTSESLKINNQERAAAI